MTTPIDSAAPSGDGHTAAEAFHPSVYIREEMDARDWGIPSMARAMGGKYATNVLALEFYLYVGPDNPDLRMGNAEDIARAFGTSAEYWLNLEAAWLAHPSTKARAAP